MISPNRMEAAAFAHLSAPEARGVLLYLERVRDAALSALVAAEDERALRRMQGRAELARDMLQLAGDAGRIIARMDAQNSNDRLGQEN
jgi:hypothetical protein